MSASEPRAANEEPQPAKDSEAARDADNASGNGEGGETVELATASGPGANEDADDAERTVTVDPTKDLWANITLNVKDSSQEVPEVSLLVTGGSGSGKSTLIQRIYSASESGGGKGGGGGAGSRRVKPTTALDYSFARRSDRSLTQVAHFWELAQNRQLSSLADIILAPEGIHAVVCAVVVDLFDGAAGDSASNPERRFSPLAAWDTAVYWLKRIDARTAEVLEKMKAKGSSTPAKLLNRAQKQCGGADNAELKRMRLSGLPTVLAVNKTDLFFRYVYNSSVLNSSKDGVALLVRAFRFLAHLYGANLVFVAAAPDADGGSSKKGGGSGEAGSASAYSESASRWRGLMSHLLFQTPLETKHTNLDLEKEHGAVMVTADKDTFADIGEPSASAYAPGAASSAAEGDSAFSSAGDKELSRWRAALEAAYPPSAEQQQQQQQQVNQAEGAGEFNRQLYETYAEPTIDAMRRQKDEELEQYRKAARLRAKEAK